MAEPFLCSPDKEINAELVQFYLDKHKALISGYEELFNFYKGNHPILKATKKEKYKPDNRLVANFAKYIVDTMNGYVMGKPVKVTHPDKEIAEAVNGILKLNNQDDNNSEISKLTSIFGHAYEFLYQNEDAQTKITYFNPMEMFLVYENTIEQKRFFAVRYEKNEDGELEGNVYTAEATYDLSEEEGELLLTESENQEGFYEDVPVIEWVENEERQSIIAPVITLIEAYNKAVSEKANDVDYFADAYLKLLGAELDQNGLQTLRDNRIINLFGNDSEKIDVGFLDKPAADGTQENLLDRIERLIYQMSMVSNINSEDFGNASGVALRFKLQSMENLALIKERKIARAMRERFELIFRVPMNISSTAIDEWINLEFQFERNIPKDVESEAAVAGSLQGIVSKETQLKALPSLVPDIEAEITRLSQEENGPDEFEGLGGEGDGQSELLDKPTNSTLENTNEEG